MPLSEKAARSKDRSYSTPQLQHRHFAFIAGVIRDIPTPAARVEATCMFRDALCRSNPAFDSTRFRDACDFYCDEWTLDDLDRAIAHATYWLEHLYTERTARGFSEQQGEAA